MWVCDALAVELDARKVHRVVRVLVVVVLGRHAKGKGGLGERGAREVVVYPIVELRLHATVVPGHGLVEIKLKVVFAVGVLYEVGSKVGRQARGTLASRRPSVQVVPHNDCVLV